MKTVSFKIGNMRKTVEWTVYPPGTDAKKLFVQSDKRALSINLETKKGFLSDGRGHPSFMSVSPMMGAVEVDVPDEIIKMCLETQPKKGDQVGPGLYIG